VNDLSEALHRAQSDPPAWQHSVDDFVAAGQRLRRRRRAALVTGTSALAVVAAAAPLIAPSVLGHRWGGGPWTGRTGPAGAGGQSVAIDPAASGPSPSRVPQGLSPGPTPPTPLPADLVSRQLDAYFRAGYSYDDAVLLARVWNDATPYDAKVFAGGKLLQQIPLPIKPGQTAAQASTDTALMTFTDHGYSYPDALKLAAAWKMGGPGTNLQEVKVLAGRKLMAGLPLPTG
jgi:hypothetical protein